MCKSYLNVTNLNCGWIGQKLIFTGSKFRRWHKIGKQFWKLSLINNNACSMHKN